jgi:hypothetical protein
VLVGVNDYSKVRDFRLGNLGSAAGSAETVRDLLARQKGRLYREVHLTLLLDQAATPDAILKSLGDAAKRVRPDDRLVLFLSGHGHAVREAGRVAPWKGAGAPLQIDGGPGVREGDRVAPGSYCFVGPQAARAPSLRGVLRHADLHRALEEVPCHRCVLVDTEHAGALIPPRRERPRPGRPPLFLLAACGPDQEGYEPTEELRAIAPPDVRAFVSIRHSFFTLALVEALSADSQADAGKDGLLTPSGLAAYTKARVPQVLQGIARLAGERLSQTPMDFSVGGGSWPLAKVRPKATREREGGKDEKPRAGEGARPELGVSTDVLLLADWWLAGAQHQATTPWALALRACRLRKVSGEGALDEQADKD